MLAITVPSRTREAVTYNLALTDNGTTCDCPGWRFTGHCYHTSALLAFAQALAEGPKKRTAAA